MMKVCRGRIRVIVEEMGKRRVYLFSPECTVETLKKKGAWTDTAKFAIEGELIDYKEEKRR